MMTPSISLAGAAGWDLDRLVDQAAFLGEVTHFVHEFSSRLLIHAGVPVNDPEVVNGGEVRGGGFVGRLFHGLVLL